MAKSRIACSRCQHVGVFAKKNGSVERAAKLARPRGFQKIRGVGRCRNAVACDARAMRRKEASRLNAAQRSEGRLRKAEARKAATAASDQA